MQHLEITDLLDAAKKVTGSDYKTAQLIGATRQMVSNWRNSEKPCPPEQQALIAYVAGLDAEEVLVRAVLARHANTPMGERLLSALGNASRRIGEKVTSAFFASVGLALAGAWLPNKAEAATLIASASQTSTGNLAADLLAALATMCRSVKCRWLNREVERITKAAEPHGLLSVPDAHVAIG